MSSERPFNYPELESILHTYQPQRLLGKEIVWEEKWDGSNMMLWFDGDKIRISSRHMVDASNEFQTVLKSLPEHSSVENLIRDALKYDDKLIVFGELCCKGYSPTRINKFVAPQFIVFDIYDLNNGSFMGYTQKYQLCFHYALPIAKALGTCNVVSMEELLSFRDNMLQACKEKNLEGVVGKTQEPHPIFFKEKQDTPKLEKIPRMESQGKIQLPQLADSEITGAVEKVRADLGDEKFCDKKIAMPLIAQYVGEECRKHFSENKKPLYSFYSQRLQDLMIHE